MLDKNYVILEYKEIKHFQDAMLDLINANVYSYIIYNGIARCKEARKCLFRCLENKNIQKEEIVKYINSLDEYIIIYNRTRYIQNRNKD